MIPSWNSGEPMTISKLESLSSAIRWVRSRYPHVYNISGALSRSGTVIISDYLEVNPSTYPGYRNEGRWGKFRVNFPAVLATLEDVQLLPHYSSTGNAAIAATVSNESVSGVDVVVCDAGGANMTLFGLWVTASGRAKSGVLPSSSLSVDFNPPHADQPLSAHHLNRFGSSIYWQHMTSPYYTNLSGDIRSDTYGLGEVVGYLFVDPNTYPGYLGAGSNWGRYRVTLPNVFTTQPFCIAIQPAAAWTSNGAILATISNTSATGFDVFVYDSGGSAIQGHALWIRARGSLKSGVLPVSPQTGNMPPPAFSADTTLTSTVMNQLSGSVHYLLRRQGVVIDLQGNLIRWGGGIGLLQGYVFVEPTRYPGYGGHGGRWGNYRLLFPEGLFEQLLYVRVQVAATTNSWATASVSNEKPDGVDVFVWDIGGTPLQGHALWVEVIGLLKAGALP